MNAVEREFISTLIFLMINNCLSLSIPEQEHGYATFSVPKATKVVSSRRQRGRKGQGNR